jgi:hypothetical protein
MGIVIHLIGIEKQQLHHIELGLIMVLVIVSFWGNKIYFKVFE